VRKRRQFESGQSTYWVPMNTQFGRNVDQIPIVPNMATMPISRPQIV
jgi:hypothetical protein